MSNTHTTRVFRCHCSHYIEFYMPRANTFFDDLENKHNVKFKFEDDRTGIDIFITGKRNDVNKCFEENFERSSYEIKLDADLFHIFTEIRRITLKLNKHDGTRIFVTGLNKTSIEYLNRTDPDIACLTQKFDYGGYIEFFSFTKGKDYIKNVVDNLFGGELHSYQSKLNQRLNNDLIDKVMQKYPEVAVLKRKQSNFEDFRLISFEKNVNELKKLGEQLKFNNRGFEGP